MFHEGVDILVESHDCSVMDDFNWFTCISYKAIYKEVHPQVQTLLFSFNNDAQNHFECDCFETDVTNNSSKYMILTSFGACSTTGC